MPKVLPPRWVSTHQKALEVDHTEYCGYCGEDWPCKVVAAFRAGQEYADQVADCQSIHPSPHTTGVTALFLVSVLPGQEVLETIAVQANNRGVANAAIVSLIGAVDTAIMSTMSGTPDHNDLVEYLQPLELSGTGEIKNGAVHIHAVLGLVGNETQSGHLYRATVESHFVNAYILPLAEPEDRP